MFKKLAARYYLWKYGYCQKHYIKKSPMGDCSECNEEKELIEKNLLQKEIRTV